MPQLAPPPVKKFTQKEKILALMCREPNKWFYPYEFMTPNLGVMFVGYKAPTRITELHKDYPTLFEKKSEDKYMQRKLNVEKMHVWYDDLPANLKDIVDQYHQED